MGPFRAPDRLIDIAPLTRRARHRHMSRGSPARERSARTAAAAPRLPLAEEVLRSSRRRERAAFKRGIWPVAGCD